MKKKEGFSLKEAEKVGEKLGLKWDKFSVGSSEEEWMSNLSMEQKILISM